jgi:hypothetical protein
MKEFLALTPSPLAVYNNQRNILASNRKNNKIERIDEENYITTEA